MNSRQAMLLWWTAGSALVWGADTKTALDQARSNYQQAVAQHGAASPEAMTARHKLRSARNNYHAQRRQNKTSASHPRH